MSNHDDPASDFYHDDLQAQDSPRKNKSKLTFKLVLLAIAGFIGYSTLGTTFAANVQLGSGAVEFGQGVRLTTACSPTLTLTPYATFANASGANGTYRLTNIDITNFDNNCVGKDFIIRAYDSATANALTLYQTGGSTNYDSVRVYNNNGTFTLADAGLSQSEISAITGGFRVTLFNSASPSSEAMAAARSVFRFTVETVEHDATLTQSLLPSGSLVFNGSSTAIKYGANSAFVLGTGDFTVEAWAKINNSRNAQTFYDAGGDVNSPGSFAFWIEGNQLKIRRNGINDMSINMDSSWWNGAYHHFAAVRGGGKFRIYVDGVMKVDGNDTGFAIDRNAPTVGILNNYGGYELQGDLRNLRVVKGTALYSANFTPAAAPLAKVSGTLLLLLAQDSNNPTYDSSNNHWVPAIQSDLPTWSAP
jgi:Concanavalin A-like lectin/glucanases superfamily